MWLPQNWRYAQSGLLGTRSGFGWVISNNTLRGARTIGLDIGIEGGYRPAGGGDNEGTNQPIPKITGSHTVVGNIIEFNGASGIQGYNSQPDYNISANVVRANGRVGCAGAENAAIKLHGLQGVLSRNIIANNTNGASLWLDSGAHDARVSRNVLLLPPAVQESAVVFELTAGPVLFDNNLLLGSLLSPSPSPSSPSAADCASGRPAAAAAAIAAQDAANITLAHNLAAGFGRGAAVVLGGLTGRKVGKRTASLRSWWVGANVLLTAGDAPWISMHHEKHAGGYELVYNETAAHNVVSGGPMASFPNITQRKQLAIDVADNFNATGGAFTAAIDRQRMTLVLRRSASVRSGCADGPGGDVDFKGGVRSPKSCVAGPLATMDANSEVNVSLWAALQR